MSVLFLLFQTELLCSLALFLFSFLGNQIFCFVSILQWNWSNDGPGTHEAWYFFGTSLKQVRKPIISPPPFKTLILKCFKQVHIYSRPHKVLPTYQERPLKNKTNSFFLFCLHAVATGQITLLGGTLCNFHYLIIIINIWPSSHLRHGIPTANFSCDGCTIINGRMW